MHLHECHTWAAQACRENAKVVRGTEVIRELFESPFPGARPYTRWVAAVQGRIDDLEYLSWELEKHACQIVDLKGTVVEAIDLFDKRRNRTVGILIAIYVPLAFATVSVVSVNIQ